MIRAAVPFLLPPYGYSQGCAIGNRAVSFVDIHEDSIKTSLRNPMHPFPRENVHMESCYDSWGY